MYRVSPGESQTNLYQTGENSNQVFDPSISLHTLDRDATMRERAAAAKVKKQQENDNDIEAQLKSMGGKAIMSHDTPLIAGKAQAVIDYTRKNIDKLRAGDMNARMGFDQAMGDLQTTTAQSVDKRQKWEQANQLMAANPDKYRPDSIQKQLEFAGSTNAGNFNYNPADNLKENIDLDKDFKENVRPQIEDMAMQGTTDYINPKTGVKTTTKTNSLTDDQIKEVLKDRLANHNIYDQAAYDLSKETPEKQKKYNGDVNQYYIDKMLPYGRINRNEKTQTENSGNGWDSKHVINATYQPTDDGKVFTIHANSQKPTAIDINGKRQTLMLGEVKQDKDGKIIGKATVQLSPAQEKENQSVRNEAYEKDVNAYKDKIATLPPEEVTPEKIAAIPKPVKDDAKYRNMKVPNSDTKTLDYTQTSQILKNTYGIDNIYETFNKDKAPAAHVDMKTTDTRGQQKVPAKVSYGDAKKAYMKKFNLTDNDLDEKDLQYLDKFK